MPHLVTKRNSLAVQKSVIWALLVREFSGRVGKYNFGLFWAFFQPITTVVMLSLIFGVFLHRTAGNIPYPLFILAGFIPFKLITRLITLGQSAIPANYGLLVFTQVKPLDPFLARFLMEAIITTVSFFIFLGIAFWIGMPVKIDNIFLLFAIILCSFLFGVGLGLCSGIITNQFPSAGNIINLLQRPLLYISCIIYPLSAVPSSLQPYFIWNPIVNAVELARKNIFSEYATEVKDLTYLIACAIVTLGLGFSLYSRRCHYLRQPTKI